MHGTKTGLIEEKAPRMGEILLGAEITNLDINIEKKIIEERLRSLQIQNATEKEVAEAMKDLGIKRFI